MNPAGATREYTRRPVKPPLNVLVCGYYGFANAGDEAILSALLADLHAAHPGATVTVLSGSPPDTAAQHGVEVIHWQEMTEIIRAAERADLMVLGGGGLFQDHFGFDASLMLTVRHGDISYWAEFALLARLTATPLAIYGVGVGPLLTEEGRRLTRLAMNSASAITVRDQQSASLLRQIGVPVERVTVTADPAFLLETQGRSLGQDLIRMEGIPTDGKITIGVAIRPWKDDRHVLPLAAALDGAVETHDARVIFVPFQASPHPHENDAHAALAVLSAMKKNDHAGVLRGEYTPSQRLAVFNYCDVAITMRFHGGIFAAMAGTPFLAISYDPKVAALMETLELPEYCIDLERLDQIVVETGLRSLLEDGAAIAGRLRAGAAELADRAAENRSVLTAALDGLPPPIDTETHEAMSSLLFARATDSERMVDLGRRVAEAESKEMAAQATYDLLAVERDRLLSSRAMAAARTYWKLRALPASVGRSIYRAAPASLHRRLQWTRPAVVPEQPRYDYDEGAAERYRGQLQRVLDDYRNVVGYVIYPPSIGWEVNLFQRPQQMALAFARLGYLVLFGLHGINREGVAGFRRVADRVILASLEPQYLDVLKAVPNPLTVTYVYNFAWARHLEKPVTVFEHIDELEVFTGTHSISNLRRWYDDALAGADVVVASAAPLLEKLRSRRPDAILCPNGVDYTHFARHLPGSPPPADLIEVLEREEPIIGYYGALAEWLDYDLIEHAARALPDHQFVFIGPDYDGSKHEKAAFELANVTWLGVKDYAELPAYLYHFDVATIPFLVNEVTHSVSPIKLFEYMAGGRPIVTTDLRECARYSVVQVAKTPPDFVHEIRRAVRRGQDPAFRELLRNTARANTWDVRAGTLIDAAARHHRT